MIFDGRARSLYPAGCALTCVLGQVTASPAPATYMRLPRTWLTDAIHRRHRPSQRSQS